MAFPFPRGLVASEITFLCEMELVTVIPRQRLEKLELLGVSIASHRIASYSIAWKYQFDAI